MMSRARWIGLVWGCAAVVSVALALWPAGTRAAPAAPSGGTTVDVIHLDGVIGPATSRYLQRGLAQAAQDNAQALIIETDTPGGLLSSMDDMTRAMLASPVATVMYVYPSGARDASAGVFVTYAANIAAMAPTTHLGAAHPVTLGGGQLDATEMTKITNDAVAQIRGFAVRRGRNADWAEQAVRKSVELTETEALRLHVIDVIASSPQDLLDKIDGRTVETSTGTHRLQTRGARLVDIPMELSEQMLLLLGDPNIGFILMTIAIYGIIFELANPGSVFPGVIGGIAAILAMASFAAIQVNTAGLFLIGFALILFIADLKVPSHGVLTAGGLISFVLGSMLLTQREAPFLQISVTLIGTMAVLTAGFFFFAVGAGVRAQRRRVQTGPQALVGALGTARSDLAPRGQVFVQGELWFAESADGAIPAGQQIRVLRVNGLHLTVRKEGDPT